MLSRRAEIWNGYLYQGEKKGSAETRKHSITKTRDLGRTCMVWHIQGIKAELVSGCIRMYQDGELIADEVKA